MRICDDCITLKLLDKSVDVWFAMYIYSRNEGINNKNILHIK
jgi:hypothetical protein